MDDATPVPAATPLPTGVTPLSQAELDALTDKLIEQLKTVFDPEIPVDIYELGLIYKVDVSDD
ncbi:MAG TPA: iron-sulfur cluster assembly protein, partial [Phenylobacterium sp.]|nr:iron-sulfur cluster assembly protein [Phenylobacterium sp.]